MRKPDFMFQRDLDRAATQAIHARPKKTAEPAPDLQSQFEDMLHTVWDTERRERMMDRLDAALDAEERRLHHDTSALRGAGDKDRLLSRDRQ